MSAVSESEKLGAHRRSAAGRRANLESLIQELTPAIVRGGRTVERLQVGLKDGVRPGFRFCQRHAGLQPSEDVEPHGLLWRRVAQVVVAGKHARLQAKREPEVGLLTARLADEAPRGDADDGHSRVADRQGPAEHIGPAAEAPLPVAVADDSVVGVAPIRVGREDAARRSTDPQDLEEAP